MRSLQPTEAGCHVIPSHTDRQLCSSTQLRQFQVPTPSPTPPPPRFLLPSPRPRARTGAGGALHLWRSRHTLTSSTPSPRLPCTKSRRRGSDRSRRRSDPLQHRRRRRAAAQRRDPGPRRRVGPNFRLLTEKRLLEVNSARMADWANLQIDIVGTVIRKLDIPDYIRFRAVCTSWNRVCACRDVSNNPRVDPWLMLPTNMLDGAKFFSIPERKNETIRILSNATLFGSVWTPVGSSHGWLLFFSPTKRIIQLVNPISGAQFQLPPVRLHHFSKAVLLDMSESNFSVAVIDGNQKGYEVTRKGSKSWSSVDSKHVLIDIFKHKRQLYTIDIYGTVELWAEPPRAWPDEDGLLMGPHLHHNFVPDEELYLDGNFAPDEEDFPLGNPHLHDNFAPDEDGLLVDPHLPHNVDQQKFNCLVETPAGDLMKVKRQSLNKFAVWILNKGTSSFERTDDIGEFALFVSHHSSLCLPAKDHPNLKANCVYFIDGYRNLCAFNLEHETKELVEALEAPGAQNQQDMYLGGRPSSLDSFLWFVPSLK